MLYCEYSCVLFSAFAVLVTLEKTFKGKAGKYNKSGNIEVKVSLPGLFVLIAVHVLEEINE